MARGGGIFFGTVAAILSRSDPGAEDCCIWQKDHARHVPDNHYPSIPTRPLLYLYATWRPPSAQQQFINTSLYLLSMTLDQLFAGL